MLKQLIENIEEYDSTEYVRVRVKDGSVYYLKNPKETNRFIRGIEVNKEGDEIHGKKFDQSIRLIEKSPNIKITKMRMSLKFATLETVK